MLLSGQLDKEFRFFMELRAGEIFTGIKSEILDKHTSMFENYYSEPKLLKTSIQIFATFRRKMVRAQFNPSNKTVLYENEIYTSPTDAAVKALKDLRKDNGKEENIDGWKFWKFYEGEEENNLSKLRRILMLN